MLRPYLNHRAEHKKNIGLDERGQAQYAEPVSIACRKQATTRQSFTSSDITIQAEHIYYLSNRVSEGDMLDGLTVLLALEWADLSGQVRGFKAVTQ